ncbi:MAG TPA: hypothetical protein VIG82_00910 [Enteractinococcus sp.]|jgi:hypothetical protein
MPARDKKPQLEIPEEELVEHFVAEDEEEDQLVLPQTKPATVNEADWVDQQIDVPIDEDEEYS